MNVMLSARANTWEVADKRSREICVLFLMSTLVMVLKSPDALRLPQFWAEDATVFFTDQLHGTWPQLLHPYSGYLHFFPRMTAWVASFVPVAGIPLVYNSIAILLDSACITFVMLRAGPIFGLGVVFLSFFILPTTGEVFGTITNVQWFTQFVLLAACCLPRAGSNGPSRAARMTLYAVLVCAALTGPVSWLIAGAVGLVFLLKRATQRSRAGAEAETLWREVNKPETWVVVAGAALHLAFLAITPAVSSAGSLRFIDSPTRSTIVRILTAPTAKLHVFLAVVMLGATLWAIYLAFIAPKRLPRAILLVFAIGLLEPVLACLKSHGSYTVFLASLSTPSRYYYLLGVVSIWVIGKELVAIIPPSKRTLGLVAMASVLVVAIALKPEYFSRSPLADYRWGDYAPRIGAGSEHLLVPVNPDGWAMEVNPAR